MTESSGRKLHTRVGTEELRLQDLFLRETSEGGPDLNAVDTTTFIQARLLDFGQVDQSQIPAQMQAQLPDMVQQLSRDFSHNMNTAKMGYAIVSYIDNEYSVKMVILEVPYQ